jgi:uncharacterized PurR-regulated membrane protein YhhQ (DUF165 family)
MDVIGRAYEPRAEAVASGRFRDGFVVLFQLALPVLLLMALGAAAFVYGDRPVAWLGMHTAQWLTLGHLMVPLTFFAIQLTNRRYGAGYAVAQIVLAWAIGAAMSWAILADLPGLLGRTLPDAHTALAFGGALFLAQLFSVLVFDRTRGPRWWTAPFLSTLWGGLLLCLIAFPVVYMGTAVDWFACLAVYAGVMAAAAVLLLVPYWLLRRVVPPLSGFGGY